MNDYLTHRILSKIIYCAYVTDNMILRILQALFIMPLSCTIYYVMYITLLHVYLLKHKIRAQCMLLLTSQSFWELLGDHGCVQQKKQL